MAANTQKKLSIAEIRDTGYLQEANRLFFHPLGLALALVPKRGSTDDREATLCVHDFTDVPSGWSFDIEVDELEDFRRKETYVNAEWTARAVIRSDEFGWVAQPIELFILDTDESTETTATPDIA